MSAAAPRILPLDPTSGELAEALAPAGDALAALAPRCERLFLIASPWAPGLTMVGAQTDPLAFGALAGAPRLSATGSGDDLASALVSCLGEMAERLSLSERAGDVVRRARVADVEGELFPPLREPVAARAAARGLGGDRLDFVAVEEIGGGRWLAPADDILLRPSWCGLREARVPASTGAAAGVTRAAALASGAAELAERRAAADWWAGRRAARAAPPGWRAAAASWRAGETGRSTRLIDVSPDGGPVCAVAVSSDVGRAGGFAFGAAAAGDFESAARAALREAMQNEVGLALARIRAATGGDSPASDAGHLSRDAWPGDARLEPSQPAAALDPLRGDPLKLLIKQGHRLAFAALSRPDVGVPAVKALAPTLWPPADAAQDSTVDSTAFPPMF
ncbi:MAG: YcaO-like family protein [Methylobacteriaceae bacterium]|nr:YcaO-like family protein [Methylobacteriaceae bacterium]